jgi:hypothetical protein
MEVEFPNNYPIHDIPALLEYCSSTVEHFFPIMFNEFPRLKYVQVKRVRNNEGINAPTTRLNRLRYSADFTPIFVGRPNWFNHWLQSNSTYSPV